MRPVWVLLTVHTSEIGCSEGEHKETTEALQPGKKCREEDNRLSLFLTHSLSLTHTHTHTTTAAPGSHPAAQRSPSFPAIGMCFIWGLFFCFWFCFFLNSEKFIDGERDKVVETILFFPPPALHGDLLSTLALQGFDASVKVLRNGMNETERNVCFWVRASRRRV